jgi:hypothetical protein
MSVGALDLE